ncbi:MAG: hypothetical protein M1816_001213 [Peltula sp. TS41687]|nr:MAG: hypothetical protein M1816_001213 [Peltula sp. TS41687]
MVPAFGFSVGDFISAINLVKKVSKALKTAGGASSDYQLVSIELRGLKHVLRQLEALEPTEDNVSHVNAIRGMALACQLPLRDFLAKLEKYETSMGPFANRISLLGAHHKAKWALSMAEDVEKLRALVAGKVISINLLLATHSSQTMSRIESRGKRDHKDLMTKILEQRQSLHLLDDGIQAVTDQISQSQGSLETRLDVMSTTANNLQTSVMNLRGLGSQVIAFMGTFSAEFQVLLRKIIHTDQQMYNLLLQIQQRISASPTTTLQSNIKFEDVLGRTRELPYEYFRHWEPFEGFLRAEFKGIPGESKVLDGQYHILDSKRQCALISKEAWTQSVFPGADLTMSMIMAFVRSRSGSCPRPSCTGKPILDNRAPISATCSDCGLVFYPTSYGPEDSLGRITMLEEDEDIVRRQAEEDTQLFGARPGPQDSEEYDEAMQLEISNKKRKRTNPETHFNTPSRRAESGKEQSFRPSTTGGHTGEPSLDGANRAVPAIDWNSGEASLNAWLNQSALPVAGLTVEDVRAKQASREQEATSLEGKELEFYRKIHIPTAPEPVAVVPVNTLLDDVEELEPGAQIYCRNIMDMFPEIPPYMARRLAEANFASSKATKTSKRPRR